MIKSSTPSPHARTDNLWARLHREAAEARTREPALAEMLGTIIIDRADFSHALRYLLSEVLVGSTLGGSERRALIAECTAADPSIVAAAHADLLATTERDPAATTVLAPFLFYKGFHALQSYRLTHWLWQQDRKVLALYLQNFIARQLAVDIHPAAVIGRGIMMDHAHGIVIGETAVVEDNVSFLHEVTLGGTYKVRGDRHPKIRTGVMLGAGAKVLGNVEIGEGTRVATGSVVVRDVPAHVTVAGVPARVIGEAGSRSPAQEMDQMFEDNKGSSI